MKKILLSGVSADISEDAVRRELADLGPLAQVTIIRDGDPSRPMVMIELPISDAAAYLLVERLDNHWHDGQRISAHLLIR